MAFGVDSSGFVLKREADIAASLTARLGAELGPEVSITRDTPEGIIARVVAAMLAEGWEMGLASYDSVDPNNAQGVWLDNLGAIMGQERHGAAKAQATVELRPSAGFPLPTTVPAGTLFSIGAGGVQFALDSSVTMVTDGLGAGDDGGEGEVTASLAGLVALGTGGLNTIVNPVAGLASVTNPSPVTDAHFSPGADAETDATFRVRLRLGNPLNDLRVHLMEEVTDILAAIVVVNNSDLTDPVSGQPPHSVHAVVYPNTVDPEEVALALFEPGGVAAGIATFGAQTYNVVDVYGVTHPIHFDFATAVAVDCEVSGLVTGPDYPADGDAQLEAAFTAYVGGIATPSEDALHYAVVAALAAVPGLVDLTVELRRDADPYAPDNVTIGDTEVAVPGAFAIV